MSLHVSTCSQLGVDARGVRAFLEAQHDAGCEVHSIVVVRHGAIAAQGWAAPYQPESRQLLYSLSKTFASAAVGIAVDEGMFGYDDLLVDHFPDLVDDRVGPKARTIRVRDALGMATGHDSDTYQHPWPLGRASLLGLFDREPEGRVGVDFAYNQMAPYACAKIAEQTMGMDLLQILERRVFPALDIAGAEWDRDAEGGCVGFSGLHLRSGDIAAFFQLLLQDGMWEGERLLPAEWIDQHRRVQTSTAGAETADWQQGYGWQCWMSTHGYRGDGAFGQFALVLPEQDAVVVLTSEQTDTQLLLNLVWQHVLPALTAGGSADADADLAEFLDGWWLEPPAGEDALVEAHTDDALGGRLDLEGDTLTWTDKDGVRQIAPLTRDGWALATWRWPHGHLDAAVAAARTGGTTTVEVRLTNTPHRFTWTLPDAGPAALAWALDPLATTDPVELASA